MDALDEKRLREAQPALNEARRVLAGLSDDERVLFSVMLMDGYCGSCGRRLADDETCHCENGE